MDYYKNLSPENITEIIDEILVTEEWKELIDYEGRYEISTYGRIKSIKRPKTHGGIISQKLNKHGYLTVGLRQYPKRYFMMVHRMVMATFKYKSQLLVDHRNRIKTDNRLVNLRYFTIRQNNSENVVRPFVKSSKYVGVTYRKDNGKWRAIIGIDNKRVNLGQYDKEEDAAQAYQNKLKEINASPIAP